MIYDKRQKAEAFAYNFFPKNRRGLSAIIVTLILILLSIVAVGVVWVVVNNVIERGEENINLGTTCLEIDVSISTASCVAGTPPEADTCTVTYGRTASGEDIGGVTLVFSNDVASNPYDIPGNVAPLVTQTRTDHLLIQKLLE